MPVVTRFAPSPTGYLHIGGARTALFNWLFARHHQGRFLLRIEDTDRARSTRPAINAIIDGLTWLGLDWDGDAVSQFARAGRHAEVARQLLAEGHAYLCYASAAELAEMRETARAGGRPMRYDGRWRDRDPGTAPQDVAPVVRFRAPREGKTTIEDLVQGPVTVANEELDDMVLLRADGTPTYMLAVVVDDHDMGITDVIRGDDHLTNAFRQYHLYRAMGWETPRFAHIPLIHGPDGAKLSKRHGALGVEAYREQGILPEALCNYLLRLGWSHGDDEIISREQAVAWFDLASVGRSPARFDPSKLLNLNGHYLRQADDRRLAELVMAHLRGTYPGQIAQGAEERVVHILPTVKSRAKTINELAEAVWILLPRVNTIVQPGTAEVLVEGGRPVVTTSLLSIDAKAAAVIRKGARHLAALTPVLAGLGEWNAAAIETAIRDFLADEGLELRDVAQPLRAALTGSTVSPPLFDVMAVLGQQEALGRLRDALGRVEPE
jgi:glutamyl-tRNA synthetase